MTARDSQPIAWNPRHIKPLSRAKKSGPPPKATGVQVNQRMEDLLNGVGGFSEPPPAPSEQREEHIHQPEAVA